MIFTRLRPGHLSVRVGDSSRWRGDCKNLEFRLSKRLIIIIILLLSSSSSSLLRVYLTCGIWHALFHWSYIDYPCRICVCDLALTYQSCLTCPCLTWPVLVLPGVSLIKPSYLDCPSTCITWHIPALLCMFLLTYLTFGALFPTRHATASLA